MHLTCDCGNTMEFVPKHSITPTNETITDGNKFKILAEFGTLEIICKKCKKNIWSEFWEG